MTISHRALVTVFPDGFGSCQRKLKPWAYSIKVGSPCTEALENKTETREGGRGKKIFLTKKRIIDVQEGDDREENKRETEGREGEGISQDKPQSRTVRAEAISINRILINY